MKGEKRKHPPDFSPLLWSSDSEAENAAPGPSSQTTSQPVSQVLLPSRSQLIPEPETKRPKPRVSFLDYFPRVPIQAPPPQIIPRPADALTLEEEQKLGDKVLLTNSFEDLIALVSQSKKIQADGNGEKYLSGNEVAKLIHDFIDAFLTQRGDSTRQLTTSHQLPESCGIRARCFVLQMRAFTNKGVLNQVERIHRINRNRRR